MGDFYNKCSHCNIAIFECQHFFLQVLTCVGLRDLAFREVLSHWAETMQKSEEKIFVVLLSIGSCKESKSLGKTFGSAKQQALFIDMTITNITIEF